jgi:single-strand DNA-binding protein
MNKVILVGRLTQDPEVKYTQSGKAVASFTLAVNRYTSGDKKEADFIPVVAWEKLAEVCGNNLTKGARTLVEGRIQVRSYETNDGQKRRVSEVIAQNIEFLEPKKQGEAAQDNPFGGQVFPEEELSF